MATLEQKKRLDKLNSNRDNHKIHLKVRWGLENSADRTLLNLTSVRHITRSINKHTGKAIESRVAKFIKYYPHLQPHFSVDYISRMLVVAYALAYKNKYPGPIHHIILYLIYYGPHGKGLKGTPTYHQIWDRPKVKLEMFDVFTKLGLPSLLVKVSQEWLIAYDDKLVVKGKGSYKKKKKAIETLQDTNLPEAKVNYITTTQKPLEHKPLEDKPDEYHLGPMTTINNKTVQKYIKVHYELNDTRTVYTRTQEEITRDEYNNNIS